MAKETVKLISAEGFEFVVDYKAACVSTTIKNMLSSQGAASQRHDAQRMQHPALLIVHVRLCIQKP